MAASAASYRPSPVELPDRVWAACTRIVQIRARMVGTVFTSGIADFLDLTFR